MGRKTWVRLITFAICKDIVDTHARKSQYQNQNPNKINHFNDYKSLNVGYALLKIINKFKNYKENNV